jgi:peptide/nickel transport system permease protein
MMSGTTFTLHGRGRAALTAAAAAALLLGVAVAASLIGDEGLRTASATRSLPPSFAHPFGTDPLGRDMAVRTVKGLAVSLQVGLAAAGLSAVVATLLGLAAATLGPRTDALIAGLVDLVLALPHLVLLILLAFVLGGGTTAVILAVALTHWPRLARVVRAEVIQLRAADWVMVSRRLGRSRLWIARHHLLPHVAAQVMVGFVLIFPHAILHEAGLTFLGFGLEPHLPAIGILLAESMRHLSTGLWWLGVLPGLALLLVVVAFDVLANQLRALLDPREGAL